MSVQNIKHHQCQYKTNKQCQCQCQTKKQCNFSVKQTNNASVSRKIENIVTKSFSHDTLGSIGHKILPVQGNQKNTFDPFYQLLQRASSCRNSLGWLVSPVSRSQKEGWLGPWTILRPCLIIRFRCQNVLHSFWVQNHFLYGL